MKHILHTVVVCLLLIPCLQAAETPAFVELGNPQEEAYFVTFSPDGKKILTTSRQFIAKIWDADTGKELQKIDAESKYEHPLTTAYYPKLTSAAFSPDGKKIVTSCWDPIARIWDVESGKQLQPLTGHTATIHFVQFSPDGKKIVTAAEDGTARIWDAESGKELRKLELPRMDEMSGMVTGIFAVFSPDGKKIITYAFNDPIVRIWDTETGKKLLELKGHSPSPCSAAFSPDGKKVIATVNTREGGAVQTWDAESGTELHQFGPHNHGVIESFLSLSSDGKKMVTAGNFVSSTVLTAHNHLYFNNLQSRNQR
ncbi:MAG: WD40 repeat domain-containing protein [Planctomycetaceae bacterium]|nr:WD40 repeat domain-containing protein [Planctomycetaceae bacterium]